MLVIRSTYIDLMVAALRKVDEEVYVRWNKEEEQLEFYMEYYTKDILDYEMKCLEIMCKHKYEFITRVYYQ